MTTPNLTQLVIPPTRDELLNSLLANLASSGIPTTDWYPGSPERTFAQTYTTAIYDFIAQIIPIIAGAGFVDYASGNIQPFPGLDFTPWIDLLADQQYNLQRVQASKTLGQIRVQCNLTSGPYTISPGDIILEFPSGNRYINTSAFVITPGYDAFQQFESEFFVDSTINRIYRDPNNQIINDVTGYAGVEYTNPGTNFGTIQQFGTGTGTVVLSGTYPINDTVTLRVDTIGAIGVATWSYQFASNPGFVSLATIGVENISGIIVTPANGPVPSLSFIAGDTYVFQTLSSWITRAGRDLETPAILGQRCRARWPSLAVQKDLDGNFVPGSPTRSFYELLARNASDQVVQVFILTDPAQANTVNVYIAGAGFLLDNSVITAVQSFFESRKMLTDRVIVSSPTTRTITLAGTIYVRRGTLLTTQSEIQTNLGNYFAGFDSEQLNLNGTIEHGWIVKRIEDVTNVTRVSTNTITINGSPLDLFLPVTSGAVELPVWTQNVSTAFTWIEQ